MPRPRPLTLSITTRGIGINLCSFYAEIAGLLPTTGKPEFELPKIYASYRALLALLESRFLNLGPMFSDIERYTNFSPMLRKFDYIMNIPIIFKRLIEAINILKYRDIVYFPAMAKNTVIGGKFIPRPENIILSNLQDTVNALTEASDDTFMHRKNFYKNNPIPGAVWNDNYVLMNPHEIIPPEYDLHNDVDKDVRALKSLSVHLRKYSHYINKDFANLKVTGSFSSFICNEMGDLRVPDRKSEEVELYDYYSYCRPQNNINSFYSRFLLRNKKVIKEGALFLLGECPNEESIAKPIYALRSEHVNSYFYAGYSYYTSYFGFYDIK